MNQAHEIHVGDDQRLARYFIYYVTTLLFFGVGAITTLGLSWYETLTVPVWTPPDIVIALVWCGLFLSAAWSLCIFWEASPRSKMFRATVALYMVNALLILGWNYLFFGLHFLSLSFIAAIGVALSVGALMIMVRRVSTKAMILLVPYLGWVLFAAALSYAITLAN